MKKLVFEQKHVFLLITLFIYALIFSLISIVNHYQLRTYALDLGVYNHALYSFANFKSAVFTLGIDGREMPFLGTHFSPIMFFYVPFYYPFGSYTLLIIQILAILSGGVVVYRYALEKFIDNAWIPKLILIQFFSIWGIYSALSFDFHNNVIAAMLVLWFVYFLEKRKYWVGLIFWVLVLISQENMAIWMIFILIGLIIKNRIKSKKFLKIEILLLAFTIIYSILVIGYIMPAIQGAENNLQIVRYSHLGSNFGEILVTVIQKPLYTLSLLFKNILEDPAYNGIKLELHFIVLVSGGICLFLRPVYLVMLIPIYAQKLLSSDFYFWGINVQYSIEFVPIISLAFIDLLQYLKKYKNHVAILITVLTIVFCIDSINHRKSKWYNKTNTMFYGKRHYNPEVNLEEIKNALKLIDDQSNVSASSCLVPHLAFREKIYHFPIVKDADYIALITNDSPKYPLSEDDFNKIVEEYKESTEFEIFFYKKDLLIFKKR
ncbi:DUF2079 domain-containing protein [Bacteroidota bacterium]